MIFTDLLRSNDLRFWGSWAGFCGKITTRDWKNPRFSLDGECTMYNIWLVQRVRWAEPLAKPRPEQLSPHTLYYTNIPWYTVPNGSARLQAVVS